MISRDEVVNRINNTLSKDKIKLGKKPVKVIRKEFELILLSFNNKKKESN